VGQFCDNCAAVYNPDQADLDGDGAGDACELEIFDPAKGAALTCVEAPTLRWTESIYSRFRVFIGWQPDFPPGGWITSGWQLTGASWTPPPGLWLRVCRSGATQLYLRVDGRQRDPRITESSEVVTVVLE
jgi:hypothetical protein